MFDRKVFLFFEKEGLCEKVILDPMLNEEQMMDVFREYFTLSLRQKKRHHI